MRKHLAWVLAGLFVAATAATAVAAEYDRYEREISPPPPSQYRTVPPPPPPPQYRTAPPPPVRLGIPHAGPYLFGNIGIFEPNGYDPDYYGTYGMSGYSSGLSGNIAFGSRVSPFAAIEATVGYFSAERGSDKASVVPVTIGGRLILPHPVFEPYLGGGIGVYFAELKEEPIQGIYSGTDESNATIGGYINMGIDFWLTPKTALNLEGRYQMLNPAFTTHSGTSFNLDMSGWELNVGIRINF